MPAAQKLSHLLALADQGPVMRAALAEEVADLLAAWPSDYPDSMRGVCEALLAKAAREVDADARARLRVVLCGDAELSARILGARPSPTQTLVATARAGDNDGVVAELARVLGIDDAVARQILSDESGAALAVGCKGASLDRAAFSALALMAHPSNDRNHAFAVLDAFETVPAAEAMRILRGWREQPASLPGISRTVDFVGAVSAA